MAKDSLEDNDVLLNAFGRSKPALDVANNMAGRLSKDNIQKVVAALDARGQRFEGKLGNMEPRTRVAALAAKARTKQPLAALDAEPE